MHIRDVASTRAGTTSVPNLHEVCSVLAISPKVSTIVTLPPLDGMVAGSTEYACMSLRYANAVSLVAPTPLASARSCTYPDARAGEAHSRPTTDPSDARLAATRTEPKEHARLPCPDENPSREATTSAPPDSEPSVGVAPTTCEGATYSNCGMSPEVSASCPSTRGTTTAAPSK